jgi:hypothetical protein
MVKATVALTEATKRITKVISCVPGGMELKTNTKSIHTYIHTYIILYFDTLASSTSAVFHDGRVNYLITQIICTN